MSWNYRLMAFEPHAIQIKLGKIQPFLEIRSVYYDDSGKANGYGDSGFPINGESLEEIRVVLQLQKNALAKPVLWAGDKFPQECTTHTINIDD